MRTHAPARGAACVWAARFAAASLLLTALLSAAPRPVFLWGTAAVWFAALAGGVYAALYIRRLRWSLGPALVTRSSGVLRRSTLWLRVCDVQASFCVQTPLMALLGLYTVGLRLPGRTVWLAGLTRWEKEALPWR